MDVVAELCAAGACGMDWDLVEERWGLGQYHAMQRHWTEVAPPAHVMIAHQAGFRGEPRRGGGGGDEISNPDDLARYLTAHGGGTVG